MHMILTFFTTIKSEQCGACFAPLSQCFVKPLFTAIAAAKSFSVRLYKLNTIVQSSARMDGEHLQTSVLVTEYQMNVDSGRFCC